MLESAEFSLTFSNDRVTTIALPVGGRWDLQYEIIDGINYVSRVESPLGTVEIIRYKRDGHLLPGGMQRVPYVIAHDILPSKDSEK